MNQVTLSHLNFLYGFDFMNSYVKKLINKAERKNQARITNNLIHKNSIRYQFNPMTESQLDKIYNAIQIPDEVKIAVCQGIISQHFKAGCKENNLMVLETAVDLLIKDTIINFDGKNKLIKLHRDKLPIKYSSRKLRMFYHLKASNNECSYINGYNDCMHLLRTWQIIYGKTWQGEPFEIDHIKPISLASCKTEIKLLNKINNLCMLYPKHNRIKCNKFPNKIFYLLKGII